MVDNYVTITNRLTSQLTCEGDNGEPRVRVPATAGANTATVYLYQLLGNSLLCSTLGSWIDSSYATITRGSNTLTSADMDNFAQGSDMFKNIYDTDDDSEVDVAEAESAVSRTAITDSDSPYTVLASDTIVECDTTLGVIAAALPAGVNGKVYTFKDAGGACGTNAVTITPDGAETIEGAATYVVNANYAGVSFYYDTASTDWKILNISGVVPSAHVLNTARSANWLAGNVPARTRVDNAASPYTVLATDVYLDCLPATGVIGLSLPAGTEGKTYTVKDIDGNAGTSAITITPNGAETIEGQATYVVNANWGAVELYYDVTTTDWKVTMVSAAALTPTTAQNFLNRTSAWLAGNLPARTAVNNAASPYTVLATDVVLEAQTATGVIGLTLPAGVADKTYTVKDVDGAAGTSAITITPDGAETIEGAATLVLGQNFAAVTLYYDATTTDWKIVQQDKYAKPASLVHLQAVAATATDTVMLAPGAGNITALRAVPGAAAAAGESMTCDVQIGGVTALSAVATIDNASGLNVVAGTVDLAADDFVAGDVITIVRTYAAGGAPTPIVNTVVDVAYELA